MDYGHTAQSDGTNLNMVPGANAVPNPSFDSSEIDYFDTAITPGVGTTPENTNPDLNSSLYANPSEYLNRSEQMNLGAKAINVDPYLPPEAPTNAGIAGITEANRANNFSEIGQNTNPELGQIIDLTPPEETAAPSTKVTESDQTASPTEKPKEKINGDSIGRIISALEKDPSSSYEQFQEMREEAK